MNQVGSQTNVQSPQNAPEWKLYNRFRKTRYQEDMRRHRSTSQPQPSTSFSIGSGPLFQGKSRSKRRESLYERRRPAPRNTHSIHENVAMENERLLNASMMSPSTPQTPGIAFHPNSNG